MNAPVAACFIASCLLVGSLTRAVERIGGDASYENFVNDPSNYHLVDDLGRPVSQEAK